MATTDELGYRVSNWLIRSAADKPVNVPDVARPDPLSVGLTTEAANPLRGGVGATRLLISHQVSRLMTGMMLPNQSAAALMSLKAIWQVPQRIVMPIDLSEPIDTLTIDRIRRFARLLQASLDMVCMDDSLDASQPKAAWHIRNLLRYRSNHHTIRFLFGSDIATAFVGYLTQQQTDLLILSPQLRKRLFPNILSSVTWKAT